MRTMGYHDFTHNTMVLIHTKLGHRDGEKNEGYYECCQWVATSSDITPLFCNTPSRSHGVNNEGYHNCSHGLMCNTIVL